MILTNVKRYLATLPCHMGLVDKVLESAVERAGGDVEHLTFLQSMLAFAELRLLRGVLSLMLCQSEGG